MNQNSLDRSFLDFLERGCERRGLPHAGYLPRCLHYLERLRRWNRRYGLTASHDPMELLERHILDSLSLLPWLRGTRCLDIGSGAGLPGLVLALAEPERQWVLLDSAAKKVRFLNQVRLELGLENVSVVQGRVESYSPEVLPDTVVCRALAPLARLLNMAGHLLGPGNQMLAMKGRRVDGELADCPRQPFVWQCHTLPGAAPETEAESEPGSGSDLGQGAGSGSTLVRITRPAR